MKHATRFLLGGFLFIAILGSKTNAFAQANAETSANTQTNANAGEIDPDVKAANIAETETEIDTTITNAGVTNTTEQQALDAQEAELLKKIQGQDGTSVEKVEQKKEELAPSDKSPTKEKAKVPGIEEVEVVLPTTSSDKEKKGPKAVYSVKKQPQIVAAPQPAAIGGLVATLTMSQEQPANGKGAKRIPSNTSQKSTTEKQSVRPKAIGESVVPDLKSKPELPPAVSVKEAEPSVSDKLVEAEKKITELQGELDQAKMRLMVAETQVERLSKILEQQNDSIISKYAPGSKSPGTKGAAARIPRVEKGSEEDLSFRDDLPVASSAAATGASLAIATVIRPMAILYSGPSEVSSKLQEAPSGTILTVEGSQGGWYRVITPEGVRAWVPASSIAVRNPRSVPRAAHNPVGAGSSEEERAMDLWKRR